LNAFAERFVRSIKSECLRRMIFISEASLRHAIEQYLAHYHRERNHQGLDNRLPQPTPVVTSSQALIKNRQRLGGMLNFYYREAA
jgi:putative transposase